MDALKRVSRNYDHRSETHGSFNINFYALRKDGMYGAGSCSREGQAEQVRGQHSAAKPLENCVTLYET